MQCINQPSSGGVQGRQNNSALAQRCWSHLTKERQMTIPTKEEIQAYVATRQAAMEKAGIDPTPWNIALTISTPRCLTSPECWHYCSSITVSGGSMTSNKYPTNGKARSYAFDPFTASTHRTSSPTSNPNNAPTTAPLTRITIELGGVGIGKAVTPYTRLPKGKQYECPSTTCSIRIARAQYGRSFTHAHSRVAPQ
jgi:hypothetical protein